MKTTLRLLVLVVIVAVTMSACAPWTRLVVPESKPPVAPTATPAQVAMPTLPSIPTVVATPTKPESKSAEARFSNTGYTTFGEWAAETSVSPAAWQPGLPLTVKTTLRLAASHLAALQNAGIKVDGFVLLVTAERTFDADGWLRLPSDERMSTLLTPTGLAIEGGMQGAVTNRFGYGFRTPVDELLTLPLATSAQVQEQRQAEFTVQTKLPADLPPGIYRLRLDYGVTVKNRYYSLNGESFAKRPFFKGRPTESHLYSPPLPASGQHVSGRLVEASKIQPRFPWVLLGEYNSNGYRGVVADEDKSRFALSSRNIIPDEVILPLYDDNGKPLTYSLEPQFPADIIEERNNIPWDYAKGELSLQVTGPDGKTVDLGTAPFVGKKGMWPTTKKPSFTNWQPPAYGRYVVTATGWLADIWGNRYAGGGTYRFWIAKRMTLATATFQGVAYPVGGRYGRDIGFAPAVPADVEVTATLYVNSDPNNVRQVAYSAKASPAGIFGTAQGAKPLPLDAPGEYHAQILAKYTDQAGHLWVSTMRHAGVVYPEDSPIVARGKKLIVEGKLVERGETHFEGWVDTAQDVPHLAHVNFPFQSGDVLLIASEQQGANKIEPVLTYELKRNPAPYDSRLSTIGASNLRLKTANGYSPHLFPEYITDWAYYYAGAPRPGFMSRFLVGEDGVRAPYWPTSPNSFGGQINASSNGDLPGDIYRLLGGVVLRQKGEAPAYAGYMASGFILPKGSNNNRVTAPGAEDLVGPNGQKARFFLVGTRPGMVYETGTSFAPAVQIDPILPATVTFTLTYPDGHKVVAQGTGDSFGSFVGKDKWLLDVPGVYRFTLEADWQGYKGAMPGLPQTGGELYVIEKERPAGATGLRLNLPEQSSFPPATGLKISGRSTAQTVYYAAVIPGAVVLQGTLPVNGGQFAYFFNPAEIAKTTPTYDTTNLVTGKSEIRDVVHLTFFSAEVSPAGVVYHSFVRLIIRGNTVLCVQ